MFGKKQREIDARGLRIDALSKNLEYELTRRHAAEKKLSELCGVESKLETAHEQIKDLAYENDDLNRKIDLLESVLKQLSIPVKLGTRTASERGK